MSDPLFSNGGFEGEAAPLFVGRIDDDRFAVSARSPWVSAFAPEAHGRIRQDETGNAEVSITIRFNLVTSIFLGALFGFLLFATGFVVFRAAQLHVSCTGALVPLGLGVAVYGLVMASFRSAARELAEKLKRTL